MEIIDLSAFERVVMCVGTIIEAKPNKKSRNPSYALKIDFGEDLGVRRSSAQITQLYDEAGLVGRQVICCVNLEPMHIGSVKSEVRVLGAESGEGVVLLKPDQTVKNGERVF